MRQNQQSQPSCSPLNHWIDKHQQLQYCSPQSCVTFFNRLQYDMSAHTTYTQLTQGLSPIYTDTTVTLIAPLRLTSELAIAVFQQSLCSTPRMPYGHPARRFTPSSSTLSRHSCNQCYFSVRRIFFAERQARYSRPPLKPDANLSPLAFAASTW